MDNGVLFKIGYGLYVLTAKEGEKDNGCIINTCMQITGNPLRILIGVSKENLTAEMIKNTKMFNLSLLSIKAKFEQFSHFGYQSGRKVDKFLSKPYKTAKNGIKYIDENTNYYMSCNVLDVMDFGTHYLFNAEMTDAVKLNDDLSVTYAFYQSNIKPKTATSSNAKGFRCKICGYIYEGEFLPNDFICPICKHGAIDFERIE